MEQYNLFLPTIEEQEKPFSFRIKESKLGDEYYSPLKVVEMIIPYLQAKGYKKIWCPFDTEESNYVKVLRDSRWGGGSKLSTVTLKKVKISSLIMSHKERL